VTLVIKTSLFQLNAFSYTWATYLARTELYLSSFLSSRFDLCSFFFSVSGAKCDIERMLKCWVQQMQASLC
jgi:hypothetical protein